MSIVLHRVDERLIHGQVVIGWGHHLRPDRFILVDDELAGSDWEQDLYRLASGGAEVLFATVDDARERLREWRDAGLSAILLTRDIGTMRRDDLVHRGSVSDVDLFDDRHFSGSSE